MRNHTQTFRSVLETLEARAYFSGGNLVANGTDGPDVIVVRYSPTLVQVYVNEGTHQSLYYRFDNPAQNTHLKINAGGGGDIIRVERLALGGGIDIDAGGGNDHIMIGSYGRYATEVDGPITVLAGAGNDDLTVNDANDSTPAITDRFTLDAHSIGWGGTNDAGADFSRWAVTYDDSLEFAKVLGSDDATQYDIKGTSRDTPIEVRGGSRNDRFVVGFGDLDSNVLANVSLFGGGGNDALIANDAVDGGDDTYRLGLTRLRKDTGIGEVYFYQFESTRVDGNLDDNTFRVEGVSNPTTLRGSAGRDVFKVGLGDLKYIRKDLTVDGQVGEDRVEIDDSHQTVGALYDVFAGQLRKTNAGLGAIHYGGNESVVVRSGAGSDLFNVTPSVGTTFILRAGANAAGGPGDRLSFTAGVQPIVTHSQLGYTYRFAGRNPVVAENFETLPLLAASIGGTLFNDKDHDGVRDGPGEQLLPGRTVYLDTNHNGRLDLTERRTTTNGDGKYLFQGLTAGNYVVRQVLPVGWKSTSPGSGAYAVTLGYGEAKTGLNFGSSNFNV